MPEDINACPKCKLRGATIDWQRFGGCPHACGYMGKPMSYEEVKDDCTCSYEDVGLAKGLSIQGFAITKDENCPQHGFKELASGPS